MGLLGTTEGDATPSTPLNAKGEPIAESSWLLANFLLFLISYEIIC